MSTIDVQIIGLGKLGKNLACALSPHVKTLWLYSRSQVSFHLPNARWIKAPKATTLTLITTPDDAIPAMVDVLSHCSQSTTAQHVIHCSGVLTSEVLSPLKAKGSFTASLHPYRAFSLPPHAQALQGCYTFFEGCEESRSLLTPLLEACGASIQRIEKAQKIQYHLAAVFASNYVVTLANIANNMIHEPVAILDLMEKTLGNLKQAPAFDKALTGPIARNDRKTIEAHLAALSSGDPSSLRDSGRRAGELQKKLYCLLALASLAIKNQDAPTKNSIHTLLHDVLDLYPRRNWQSIKLCILRYLGYIMKLLIATVLCLLTTPLSACFTMIVGKDASATQTTLISRNSDSKDALRGKILKTYSTTEGRKLYIGLPYWDLVFDPGYDMAQVANNQYGVAISATETIQSNRTALTLDPPSYSGSGVSEPNIPAIVMPGAVNAKEAVKILGKAIETRGVNDGWGFGVLISDYKEIWYLETLSGHQWVAIKIPDNVYFVAANGPGQIQEYLPQQYTYLFSNYNGIDPITFASQAGFAHYKNGVFNFRESYGDVQSASNRNNNFIRVAYAQYLLNPSTRPFNSAILEEGSYPMFLVPEHPITLNDIAAVQSSHYEEFPEFDPYQWSYETDTKHPFYYPIANLRTSNSHITEMKPPHFTNDYAIASIEYIALGMPTLSVYLPIYYGLSKIPTRLQGVTNKADNHSLFWQFRKIQALVFFNDSEKNIPYEFEARKAYVQKQYQDFSKMIEEKQKNLEAAYLKNPELALIDQFTQEITDKVAELNDKIIRHYLELYEIDSRYALSNSKERNIWFTQVVREQDCFYRRYPCDPFDNDLKMQSRRDKYVDE